MFAFLGLALMTTLVKKFSHWSAMTWLHLFVLTLSSCFFAPFSKAASLSKKSSLGWLKQDKSRQPGPVDIANPTEDTAGLVLYPELERVEDMTPSQIANILQVNYSKGSALDIEVNVETLADVIAINYAGRFSRRIAKLLQLPDRPFRPSFSVLLKLESESRLISYLGLSGCMAIVKSIIITLRSELKYKTIIDRGLEMAIEEVEDFVEFALKAFTPDLKRMQSDPNYDTDAEITRYLAHGDTALICLHPERTPAAKRIIPILAECVGPWLADESFFELYEIVGEIRSSKNLMTMRASLVALAKYSDMDTFTSLKFIGAAANLLSFDLATAIRHRIDAEKNLYPQMMSILRALLMIDTPGQIKCFLRAFYSRFGTYYRLNNLYYPFLFVLNAMMMDTEFVHRSSTEKVAAHSVLMEIFNGVDINLSSALDTAIELNLMHLTEMLLKMVLPNANYSEQYRLVERALYHNYSRDSLELIFLVLAYCKDFNANRLYRLSIKRNIQAASLITNWDNIEQVRKFNDFSVGKFVFFSAACVLESQPKFASQPSQTQIPWPCPRGLFYHQLMLFEVGRRPFPPDSYPFFTAYNAMQMVLLKEFGITFAESRILQDVAEAPEWSDILTSANLMIERLRPEVSIRFYDNIAEELSKKNIPRDKIAIYYLKALENKDK